MSTRVSFEIQTNTIPLLSLVGIGGIVVTDRLLGNTYGNKLKERFEHALETEFTDPDGSILPIRSELTGFTVCTTLVLLTSSLSPQAQS